MSIKIRIPKSGENGGKRIWGLPRDPILRAGIVVFLVVAVSFISIFSYYYVHYDRIIERRFRTPVFANSAKIYALPKTLRDGEKIDAKEIAADLREAGYSDAAHVSKETPAKDGASKDGATKDGQSVMGSFRMLSDGIEVTPGPESYHSPEPARITIADGEIDKITSKGNELSAYELEPQLVTALFDSEQRSNTVE